VTAATRPDRHGQDGTEPWTVAGQWLSGAPDGLASAWAPSGHRRIGGLLDAQPLGQGGRQQQAGVATAWVSSKQMSSWSRVWEDPIEKAPS
jgi:hypothetical protein